MNRWRYRITVHSVQEILSDLSGPPEPASPMLFCDEHGVCTFDSAPNPLLQAMERVLNRSGEEGWELVQIAFRPEQMVAFWKRPLE
jgi:hypothetical protein